MGLQFRFQQDCRIAIAIWFRFGIEENTSIFRSCCVGRIEELKLQFQFAINSEVTRPPVLDSFQYIYGWMVLMNYSILVVHLTHFPISSNRVASQIGLQTWCDQLIHSMWNHIIPHVSFEGQYDLIPNVFLLYLIKYKPAET